MPLPPMTGSNLPEVLPKKEDLYFSKTEKDGKERKRKGNRNVFIVTNSEAHLYIVI